MNPASIVDDPRGVLSSSLTWEVDPDDFGWFKANYAGDEVYLRMNNFPDENLFSLWIGNDEYIELEELPPKWSISPGRITWPSTARRITRRDDY